MSLIEKALRELPESLAQTEQPPVTKPATPPPAPPVEQKPIHSWSTASASAPPLAPHISVPQVLAIAAVLFCAVALVRNGRKWQTRAAGPGISAVSASVLPLSATAPTRARPSAAARADMAPRTTLRTQTIQAQAQLVLNGVAEGVGEPYAVINGSILGVGDRIGNFTLVEIANGAARLRETNGNETVLRVSH